MGRRGRALKAGILNGASRRSPPDRDTPHMASGGCRGGVRRARVQLLVPAGRRRRKYSELAENNHQRTLSLRAARGVLFDRNFKVLVDSRPSLNVSLDRERTKDLEGTIAQLAMVAGLDPEQMRQAVDRHKREPRYRPIPLIEDATEKQVARIKARRLELPGVLVENRAGAEVSGRWPGRAPVRLCRPGQRTAGDAGDPPGVNRREIRASSCVYNQLLMGEDGVRRVRVNSVGREVGETIGQRDPPRGTAGSAHDRLRPAESRRRRLPSRGLQRRGAHHGPAERRSADLRQPAGLRPQRLRRRYRQRDVGGAQHRQAAPVGQPGDSRALFTRVDVQDRRRGSGARRRPGRPPTITSTARAAPTSSAATTSVI